MTCRHKIKELAKTFNLHATQVGTKRMVPRVRTTSGTDKTRRKKQRKNNGHKNNNSVDKTHRCSSCIELQRRIQTLTRCVPEPSTASDFSCRHSVRFYVAHLNYFHLLSHEQSKVRGHRLDASKREKAAEDRRTGQWVGVEQRV